MTRWQNAQNSVEFFNNEILDAEKKISGILQEWEKTEGKLYSSEMKINKGMADNKSWRVKEWIGLSRSSWLIFNLSSIN